jgi:hypothetical protein
MRWGLALGAAATLGAAALIGTQWAGHPSATTTSADAASPAPGGPPAPSAVKDAQGRAYAGGFWAGMMAGAAAGVPGLDPVGEKLLESSQDLPAGSEGPAGTRSSKTRISVTGSGTRVTVLSDEEITELRGSARRSARARLSMSLDYCPDADGKVLAQIDYQASGDSAATEAGGSAGFSDNLSAKGTATGHVDDQALLVRIEQALHVEHSTRGGQNPAVGQGQASRKAIGGAYGYGADYPVSNTPGDKPERPWVREAPGGTRRFDLRRSDDEKATLATLGWLAGPAVAIDRTFEQAQGKWRSGACLELLVRAPLQAGGKTNPTQPKERKNFEVAVRHKSPQAELPLPLQASLDGRDSLQPQRVDQAPGRFDYVAGSEPKDYGRITLKSVSRRGIAQELVVFDNQQHLGGPFSARSSGVMQLVVEGQVHWQAKPGAPDEYTPIGELRVSGKRRDCTVSGSGDLVEGDGELHVQRDAEGKPAAYRGYGIKTMPLRFVCPKVTRTQDMPVAWFGTTESFRPVGADGTLQGELDEGEVRWTWRFGP